MLKILGGKSTFEKKLGIIKPVFDRYADKITEKINEILKTNMVSGVNIYTKQLENKLKKYLQSESVLAMSSCTAAMILTMQALKLRDCEVIIPSFTFSATAHMLYWNNCKPVFADVDENSFNISAETVEKVMTSKTKAVLGVHLYGNPIDIKPLDELCESKNIHLLFDGAHALGTEYHGKKIGGFGTATAYSASPTKLFSTIEGGFLSTDNKKLAEILDFSRNYGNKPDYSCSLPGLNARLSEINAVSGLVQFPDLELYIENRNNYANKFTEGLNKIPGLSFQFVDPANRSTYKDYSIIVDEEKFGLNRNQLEVVLLEEGIQTKKYFYPPVHSMAPYRQYVEDKDLPNTMHLTKNVLSLPIYSFMVDSEINGIVNAIKMAHRSSAEILPKLK
jgi:dTDP-4-amino-4,6-dideoxygalactose transaminase